MTSSTCHIKFLRFLKSRRQKAVNIKVSFRKGASKIQILRKSIFFAKIIKNYFLFFQIVGKMPKILPLFVPTDASATIRFQLQLHPKKLDHFANAKNVLTYIKINCLKLLGSKRISKLLSRELEIIKCHISDFRERKAGSG